MSQVFTADGVDLGTDTVRAGTIEGFTTQAELGGAGISQLVVDDPDGTLTIGGLKDFTVDEDAAPAGNQRSFTGRILERAYRRGQARESSLRTGAAREIAVSLVDLNTLLSDKIITSGVRAAETVTARTSWLLANYLTTVADNGFVATSSTTMDATDYTGQKATDVLADISLLMGWNYFVYYDESAGEASLWLQDSNTSPDWGSGMSISNVLSDIDPDAIANGTATTFFAAPDTQLIRNPARVYSGCYLPYAKGYVYVTDGTIESNFAARDGSAPNANVRTQATATSIATDFLTENATEDDRITCTIQMAAAQVNAILAGQLVQARFSHYANEGYGDFTSMRVMKRSVAQRTVTDQLYQVTLELSPADTAVLTATFAELQEQAGPANGHASPYSSTGPGDYEIVYSRNGDNPDAGWPSNPKYGLISYAPVYTDAGAPLGEYFRGLTVTGDGDVAVEFIFSCAYLASGTDTRRLSVLKNGVEVLFTTDSDGGGLRFISYTRTVTGTVSVVAGDVLSGLYATSGAVGGSITIGGGLAEGIHFRVTGSLA